MQGVPGGRHTRINKENTKLFGHGPSRIVSNVRISTKLKKGFAALRDPRARSFVQDGATLVINEHADISDVGLDSTFEGVSEPRRFMDWSAPIVIRLGYGLRFSSDAVGKFLVRRGEVKRDLPCFLEGPKAGTTRSQHSSAEQP